MLFLKTLLFNLNKISCKKLCEYNMTFFIYFLIYDALSNKHKPESSSTRIENLKEKNYLKNQFSLNSKIGA